MYHYDFIEIGTSNFDTIIETSSDSQRGLSIEPVRYYLDQLPNRPLVTKLNCAISPTNESGHIDVYYIPEDLISKNNLPWWLKGCNSVGQYHRFHRQFNLEDIVVIERVEVYPIAYILLKHRVHAIDFLKIDTEGQDIGILNCLYDYLRSKDRSYFPKRIRFETSNTDEDQNSKLVMRYASLGYRLNYTNIDDTEIILEP